MITTDDRTEINRINSKHSTGPKTKAGKLRSSQNALRHGLTAESAILPTDDRETYRRHVETFYNEYHPQGATETHLVQTMADTAWRQNRIASLEDKLVAAEVPDVRALSNLSLHSQRLNRQFEKTLLLLKEVQGPRLEAREQELQKIADLIQMHQLKEEPYDPAEDGFVFSNAEIEAFLTLRSRDHRALLAGDYLCELSEEDDEAEDS
jgi:hypothetical protein